jgi:toxin ParE1/3/4
VIYYLLGSAQVDVEAIGDFIARENPRAAARLVDRFEERWGLLTTQPYLGRDRGDLAEGIRATVVGEYLTFYRVSDIGIEIVRVLHGRRNITADDF